MGAGLGARDRWGPGLEVIGGWAVRAAQARRVGLWKGWLDGLDSCGAEWVVPEWSAELQGFAGLQHSVTVVLLSAVCYHHDCCMCLVSEVQVWAAEGWTSSSLGCSTVAA